MVPSSSSFLVSPNFSRDEYIRVTPQSATWEHLSFAARQIRGGGTWDFETQEDDAIIPDQAEIALFPPVSGG